MQKVTILLQKRCVWGGNVSYYMKRNQTFVREMHSGRKCMSRRRRDWQQISEEEEGKMQMAYWTSFSLLYINAYYPEHICIFIKRCDKEMFRTYHNKACLIYCVISDSKIMCS